MGTRRSKHNFGRKPLYKEHRRNLEIADVVFRTHGPNPRLVELYRKHNGKCFYCARDTFLLGRTNGLQATTDHYIPSAHGGEDIESNLVLACHACNNAKASKLPTPELLSWLKIKTPRRSPRRHVPRPVQTELEAQVEAYLARKREERNSHIETVSPLMRHNAEILALPEVVHRLEYESFGDIKVSSQDALLQLFADKRIHGAQFSAGRLWQRLMQSAMLQPARCVDWSAPVSRSYRYQMRGTITDRQFEAMRDRAAFRAIAGARVVSALDVCLEHGRGLADLCSILRVGSREVGILIAALLDEFARFAANVSWERFDDGERRREPRVHAPMAKHKRRSRVPVLREPKGLRLPPPQRLASLPVLHLP